MSKKNKNKVFDDEFEFEQQSYKNDRQKDLRQLRKNTAEQLKFINSCGQSAEDDNVSDK